MRPIVLFVGVVLAAPSFAEDFQALAPVSEVVIYPNGAGLIRDIELDVPAGQHRILIPLLAQRNAVGPPRISGGDAVSIGAVELLEGFTTDATALYSQSQQDAEAALEQALDAVTAQQDRVAELELDVIAADAELAFYRSVSGVGLDTLNAEALRAAGELVATELARIGAARQTAELAVRGAREELEEFQRAAEQAARNLELSFPPNGPVDMLGVTVDAAAAQIVSLTMEQLVSGAGWRAEYDLHLNTEGDALVEMTRKVLINQSTSELWSEVGLSLSTADPFAQLEPREPRPNKASIGQNTRRYTSERAVSLEAALADGSVREEAVIVEDERASVVIDGLSVTYDYPSPVTVSPDGALILALDELSFEAERFIRAVPRLDQTAFLMARLTNDQSEPLLPGNAQIFRDDKFVGRIDVDLIPAGSEAVISFGTLEGIRLSYDLLNNDTGDRGLLASSSTRKQLMEFRVENLTGKEERVETVFSLPFSEQEDLQVDARARPAPDSTDFEKRRGVSVWDMTLGAGEAQTVRIEVDLAWPEGQALDWQP